MDPSASLSVYRANQQRGNEYALVWGQEPLRQKILFQPGNFYFVYGWAALPPAGNDAVTLGKYVFMDERWTYASLECCGFWMAVHEYIHVLQWQGYGANLVGLYGKYWFTTTGPKNPVEAPAYMWERWLRYYGKWEKAPWEVFKPLP